MFGRPNPSSLKIFRDERILVLPGFEAEDMTITVLMKLSTHFKLTTDVKLPTHLEQYNQLATSMRSRAIALITTAAEESTNLRRRSQQNRDSPDTREYQSASVAMSIENRTMTTHMLVSNPFSPHPLHNTEVEHKCNHQHGIVCSKISQWYD